MESPCTAPLPRIGRRIALRRLRAGDLPEFQAYRRDADTGRYQGWTPQTDAQSLAFLVQMESADLFVPGEWVQLGIAERATDGLIGDVGIRIDPDGATAEIGFTLGPGSRGAGLGAEAVAEAMGLIFDCSCVARVIGITDARNASSIRLLERVGMRQVDTVRTEFRGEPCVELVYALSRDARG
ncbi:MAG: GNAT family N-acetyltransferase [Betaproteobacteria bacterium]|nr:GNAT family N-acetyltransferase [Betaproteobacteria bacterium]